MSFLGFGKKKDEPKYRLMSPEEANLLAHLRRGSLIGNFVVICRTDFLQPFSDNWITGWNYYWNEHLLLNKDLLKDPSDLSALVYVPDDMGEVYLVDVPYQSPDLRYLTSQGRRDYELSPGYENEVNNALAADYAVAGDRAIYHSIVDEDGQAGMVTQQALSGQIKNIKLRYEGVTYIYTFPEDPNEAASAMYTANATRHGAYPMEESLKEGQKYDLVPAIPDGATGVVRVREYYCSPDQKPPFERLSFQESSVPPNLVKPDEPSVFYTVALGNGIAPNLSVGDYLGRHYTELGIRSPHVRFESLY